RNNQPILYIRAGEKTTMKIKLNVLNDAEYVLIEVPIPAGCTYAAKKQPAGLWHVEYLANKDVLFYEQLKRGEHLLEIELEPRYKGRYTLNPAKAELMYFPSFYGRGAIKEVEVR